MNLLKMTKWNELFSEIKSHSLFKTNLTNLESKILLSAPLLAARQILNHAPQLLNKNEIRICIAGAGYMDTGNKGDAYRLLPKLLDKPEVSIMIDFIGPESMSYQFRDASSIKAPDVKNVIATFEPLLLGEYLSKGIVPDVIILNMPGFESHHESWLDDDDGLARALENNIPVLGASFSDDEAELDGLYAAAYGFAVRSIERNPFTYAGNEFFEWAGETWVLSAGTGKKDDELIELCVSRGDLFLEYVDLQSRAYKPHELPAQIKSISNRFSGVMDGKKYIWVHDDVYYFPELNVIKNLDGVVLVDDVMIDTTYTHSIKHELIKATMSAAVIRRDYGEPDESKLLSMFSDNDRSQEFSDSFMDSLRLSRPFSPKDCAEALADSVGWNVDVRSAEIENEHLEATFSIRSNSVTYPVVVTGLGSTIVDYHDNADPLLIGIIDALKERHASFILLVGEGSVMHNEKSNLRNHLLGVIHRSDTTSFLFLCNVEPDDQRGRFNIEDEIALQDWANVNTVTSDKYSSKVLRGVEDLCNNVMGQLTH